MVMDLVFLELISLALISLDKISCKMKTKKINTKAQSIIEYAILLAVVSAAIAAMYTYLNRTVQGRLKQIESQVNEPVVVVGEGLIPSF